MSHQQLEGVFPAVPVPMTAERRIHEEAHASYTRYMREQDVAGVAIWVHTGRGLYLTREEREYVCRAWREALRPEQKVIAGVGVRLPQDDSRTESDFHKYLDVALQMAAEAKEWGADYLLVHPPTFLRQLAAEKAFHPIIEYHRQLGSIGLPLILFYLYEAAGGVTYQPELLRELLRLPVVAGIKMATLNSVMTYQDVARMIEEEFADENKALITGEDRFVGYSFLRGAKGSLLGLAAGATHLQTELWKAAREALARGGSGEAALRFLDLTRRVDILAEATFRAPMEAYITRMLWVLYYQGVIPAEAVHEVFAYSQSEEDLRWLRRAMKRAGVELARSYGDE